MIIFYKINYDALLSVIDRHLSTPGILNPLMWYRLAGAFVVVLASGRCLLFKQLDGLHKRRTVAAFYDTNRSHHIITRIIGFQKLHLATTIVVGFAVGLVYSDDYFTLIRFMPF